MWRKEVVMRLDGGESNGESKRFFRVVSGLCNFTVMSKQGPSGWDQELVVVFSADSAPDCASIPVTKYA